MKIVFTPNALAELIKFEIKDQIFVRGKIVDLSEIDDIFHHPNVKKLKTIPYFRFRAGDFRIFFDINGSILWVQKILRRNEKTYKK